MSRRHRLGVVLLLDPPVSVEVDGLRRALGDGALGAIPPHVTLVPPVNVRADELDEALEVLLGAAHRQRGPLELVLGPVSTFLPANPVVYLAVGGPSLGDLASLRQAVLAGPLRRSVRWPWAPHVTLCDEAPPERIAAAVEALASFEAMVTLDRAVLLEEVGRRWSPVADAFLGRPAVAGRGGLELELTESTLAGPDVAAMVGDVVDEVAEEKAEGRAEGAVEHFARAQAMALAGAVADARGELDAGRPHRIVLTARHHGEVVGAAVAWAERRAGSVVEVCVLVEHGWRRLGVGRALLVALEARVRERGWAPGPVRGHGPPEFFSRCSAWAHGPGD